MTELVIEQENKKNRVWDNLVPIVKTGKKKCIYDIYLMDDIQSPGNYSELVHILKSAKKYDIINIHISNYGGVLDSSLMLWNCIKESEAKVVGYLYGSVASAATIVALACDIVFVNDFVSWLSHNYSSIGGGGKGAELKAKQEFDNKYVANLTREIHKGFLTDKEIEELLDDKDFWFDGKEVKERLKIRQEIQE